jgi:3-hydroxyisobutyrate dehydrogenase-like beta-hydroxyacid dehydrogenase
MVSTRVGFIGLGLMGAPQKTTAFALTPGGATVFIAGPTGFIVQPITP